MANQVEIAAHLFCVFSSRGRNNREIITTAVSLSRHKSLGTNTDVIKRVECNFNRETWGTRPWGSPCS